MIELHGSLQVWRCDQCGQKQEERGEPFAEYPPRCGGCGGLRRPDVVWFGEGLPPDALAAADQAVRHCQLCLSVGTSGQVYPAAGLIETAIALGAKVIEINPSQTPISSHVDWALRGKAGHLVPLLVERAFPAP